MRVEVIVPWRGGCPWRTDHLGYVTSWLSEVAPVVVAEGPDDGPWVKAAAVNPAVQASGADIVVVHDADVWSPGLRAAIAAVDEGAAWAIPHDRVHRLQPGSTVDYVRNGPPPGGFRPGDLVERPYRGIAGGGIVAARRDVLLDVPLDPRFVGWGCEDSSWGYALGALHGAPQRPPSTRPGGPAQPMLVHLWHPPQERPRRGSGSAANEALRRRYVRARRSPEAMREVVGEVVACR